MAKRERVLITGGAGFIGSHLAELLLPEHPVVVIDNFSTGSTRLEGVEYVEADISTGDGHEITAEVLKNVTQVYHLAAGVGVRYTLEHPEAVFKTNLHGAHWILTACAERKLPLLFTSSSAVYGRIEHAMASEEDDVRYGHPQTPEWLYSFEKALVEGIVGIMGRAGSAFKIVRIFNCIGTRQVSDYGMVVPTFIRAALRGESVKVYGTGGQERTFSDVRDVVVGMKLVMDEGEAGKAYNLGGKSTVSMTELARRVIQLTDSRSSIVFVPYSEAFRPEFDETQRRCPNLRRIQNLGYKPHYKLDETLKWIIDDERKKLAANPEHEIDWAHVRSGDSPVAAAPTVGQAQG